MFPEFVKSLLKAEAYPHPVGEIELVQTHISYVFLTGSFVYKIKKPVDLGFLDFTTLEKRKCYCEREVSLNKRLSPAIYLSHVPVTTDGRQFHVGGPGEVIEYAVKMRQMPEDRMMNVLIREGKVERRIIEGIVSKLVPFFASAATGPDIDFYGEIPQVSFNVEEDFIQTEAYIGRAITREQFEAIRRYAFSFLEAKADLFEERIRSGRVRDGHGDLHSGNICIADDVYIYDCIEFNERFRYEDVASDIAFLAMDLDFNGLADLSRYFVGRFVELSGDDSLMSVLNFYKCYRAYVRGKIHCFSADSEEIDEKQRQHSLSLARRYFDLAYYYAAGERRPSLYVFFGPIAGGKSTLSRRFGETLGIIPLNSDRVRKELAGLRPTDKRPEAFGQGIYSPEFSRLTYARLREEAEAWLKSGASVILDAAYGSRTERTAVADIAQRLSVPHCFIYCHCSENETKARLERRAKNATAVSDGRWEIYLEQARVFDPPEEIPRDRFLDVITDGPKDKVLASVRRLCPVSMQFG